ncbi:MAG: 30S ribosomal protein S4e [Candidatus Thorarchaeota archaeon]
MGKKGAKKHTKRIAAPVTYKLPRKTKKFTFHARNGAQPAKDGIPLGIVLRDIWNVVLNRKEMKFILNSKNVLVDGVPINDSRYIVGPMDVISLPAENKHYRVLPWQGRRKLNIVEINPDHATWKFLKVKNKITVKHGDIQLNCTTGRNILLKKPESGKYESKWDNPATFSTNGTIKFDINEKKILDFYPFTENASVLVTAGVNTGKWGYLQLYENRIGKNRSICIIKNPDGQQIITAMENVFVIGGEKPDISHYQIATTNN